MYLPFASSSGISTAKYAYVSKLNKRPFLLYFRETAALLPQKWYFKQITQNPSKSLKIQLLKQKRFTMHIFSDAIDEGTVTSVHLL